MQVGRTRPLSPARVGQAYLMDGPPEMEVGEIKVVLHEATMMAA